jgi:hypothetical protein
MGSLLFLLGVSSCHRAGLRSKTPAITAAPVKAKFEPEDGYCLLFVGQELEAIGGLEAYNEGYLDYFETPAGFTMYTSISPGINSYGYVMKGLDGIWNTANWGAGPSNLSLQLADEDFKNMALAIGLSMVHHEQKIARGRHDEYIIKLGKWLKSLHPRPVFLRIGYEFAGEWNHYEQKHYLAAYRRIKEMLDEMGVQNVAYVWQSHGWEEPLEQLEAWYPGDEYVDWCGYSFFSRWDEANMIAFARQHNKPVFIAEATPTISTANTFLDGSTKETVLGNEAQAAEAWEKWFMPFFRTIEQNPDVVKAASYINAHWKSHSMWMNNPTFKNIDARLQTSEMIYSRWKAKTRDERYLKASPDLFETLWQYAEHP